MLLFLRQARM